MKRETMMALLAAFAVTGVPAPAVLAQSAAEVATASNQIESLDVVEQAGSMYVRVRLKEPLSSPPPSFSVANPARIAFDFPWTANALGRTQQNIAQGDLRSANIVQVGDRTRLVLNMTRVSPYETRIEGREVIIALTPNMADAVSTARVTESTATFATSRAADPGLGVKSIQDITFRRGKDGEGRIVVQLSDPETGIDIRPEGGNLVVEFINASLPDHLKRRSDVTDFGTPIASMSAQATAENVRLVVSPSGMWEHNAYQSDRQFVLEVRKVVEDPNRLVQGLRPGEFGGEKLSLNFQNIDVRSVLQVIADFTNFNIVTSDSVQGNLTLRLKDVPWDQALDIILQAKGLDMRKNGNVIWIAPGDELAAREKMLLEAQAQIGDLEPLQTESFQINYHRAKEIHDFLSNKDQSVLSSRGSVVFDDRSNKVFATDVGSRLAEVRRLINEIDTPPRQVLIEARIVEANKDFARDLGVRLGVGASGGRVIGYDAAGNPIRKGTLGGALESTAQTAGQVVNSEPWKSDYRNSVPGGLNVNLPAGGSAGALSMVLWNNAATRFINLELSALESDGRGRVISSPKVLTANQVEASIEQGTEIAYQEATSSGATSVAFKKAVLSLTVRPQITPDGRVQLAVAINKDRPDYSREVLGVPPIDTKNVRTEVLVENGGTVVLGGIFEEEETNNVNQIPFLGDIPVVGNLFKSRTNVSSQRELLVFITPRIVSDDLTLR
ncbi:MAG: type IV pilus secretin PilQ family protein [Rhodocyclaceae bacterium]